MKPNLARRTRRSVLAAAMLCAICGCAGTPRGADDNPTVKVYKAGQISAAQYDHVRYLWADTWRTAFWLPSAASEAEGIASLQEKAASLGANGLINVSCIDQGSWFGSAGSQPSFLCYGHAIRVR